MGLAEKSVLVTGSTTGIGKAVAKACLEEGALVLLHGLEVDLGEELIEEMNPDRSQVAFRAGDLADPDTPAKLVQGALDEFGRLDALVNNAAWVWFSRIPGLRMEDYDRCLAINLRAPLFLIQEALPHLTGRQGGVVNIGSVNAYCGEPDLLPYAMSKGGLMTLTRNLGDTLHRENGVRVNQVNPGWVLTENERQRKIEQGMPENWYEQLPDTAAPSGRIFTPEEVAAAVVFFLSGEAGPVSGSVLDLEQYPFIGRNPPKV